MAGLLWAALLAAGAHAATPPPASPGSTTELAAGPADPRAGEPARTIVAEDGTAARWASIAALLQPIIARQFAEALGLVEPAKKDAVAGVVQKGLDALGAELVEARVSALAQTYTAAELDGVVAFRRGLTGQAYQQAVAERSRQTMAGTFVSDGPEPSGQKLVLINRIFEARDTASEARRAWRVLNKAMAQAMSVAGLSKDGSAPMESPEDRAREDAYAKDYMASEGRFYAKTFSEDQLAELAAYFGGPAGRAERAHAPELSSRAANLAADVFNRHFDSMDAEACETVSCTSSQRAALDGQVAKIRSMMTSVAAASTR